MVSQNVSIRRPVVQPPGFMEVERVPGAQGAAGRGPGHRAPRPVLVPTLSSALSLLPPNKRKLPLVPFPMGNGKAAAASFTLWESLFFKFG